jgi:hypothetical protein
MEQKHFDTGEKRVRIREISKQMSVERLGAMLHGYSKGGDVYVSDTRRIRGYRYSDTPV